MNRGYKSLVPYWDASRRFERGFTRRPKYGKTVKSSEVWQSVPRKKVLID